MRILVFVCAITLIAPGEDGADRLPAVQVFSDRIANQLPAGTFAMPVSALRYEPRVDLQARGLVEAQSDISIRGGIFESTGVKLGGISLGDPQTGHYLAEIPIAPDMLTVPRILVGSDLALGVSNALSGAVAYEWRPIQPAGIVRFNVGQGSLTSASAYQGFRSRAPQGRTAMRADVAWARSSGDGLLPDGDHDFERANVRFQLGGSRSQTDMFAGYQGKNFGLRNLYTPFNSPESENLQTLLLALNHRTEFSTGSFVEASVFYRRNKDDYAFNRYAPVGPVHPFQHTTWLSGAAVSGRQEEGGLAVVYRGEVQADELRSTALVFGPYKTRTIAKITTAAEKTWPLDGGSRLVAKLGGSVDDSNRTRAAASPAVELAREWTAGTTSRVYLGFSGATQLPSYTATNSNPAAGLFRGKRQLGREYADNLEAGWSGSLLAWSLQAAAFYRRDRDLVDWTYRRGVTARSANAVDIGTAGVEIGARRSWSAAEVVLGYTGLTKNADYKGAVVDASFYALNYAHHRLTAALIWHLDREWELRFDNAARVQADNSLRAVGGDEALVSALGLTYRPRSVRGASVSLGCDNLWNSNYQEVPAVPAIPRLFSVGLAYAW
jgi:hypothetical protein